MHALQVSRLIAAWGLAFSASAQSATLSEVYRGAYAYDAQYASARASYQAVLEKLPQARAGLRPNVSGDAYLAACPCSPHRLPSMSCSTLSNCLSSMWAPAAVRATLEQQAAGGPCGRGCHRAPTPPKPVAWSCLRPARNQVACSLKSMRLNCPA